MHDVAIVGTGPVGGLLALALAGHDLDLVALDARAAAEKARGDRTIALAYGSRLICERLGLWRLLLESPGAVTPITSIDISQARGFGAARLEAKAQGVEALGYVVSYAALQGAIDAELSRAGVDVRFATVASQVTGTPACATIALAQPEPARIEARLAAVADGTGTAVAGIVRDRHDYGQVALVASVWLDRPHGGVAYERFTSEGPVALLPENDHYGLVWTMRPAEGEVMCARDEPSFLAALQAHFGTRVTGFARVAGRRSFPLSLERARPLVSARAVVIGNAAQQLHPVAGQGLNLGLRDAWELAQAVLDARRDDIGAPAMLARYAARRRSDRAAGIGFTHGLVRVFGNDLPALRWPRGIALAALDALPVAKNAFTRAMLHGLR